MSLDQQRIGRQKKSLFPLKAIIVPLRCFGTIAAHGTESHPSIFQAWINAAMSWTCLFIYVIIHVRSKDIVQKLYADLLTPAEFTLLIRKIPTNATKEDLWTWVEENGTPKGRDIA